MEKSPLLDEDVEASNPPPTTTRPERRQSRTRFIIGVGAVAFALGCFVTGSWFRLQYRQTDLALDSTAPINWTNIDTLVTFGDSWTSTRWWPEGTTTTPTEWEGVPMHTWSSGLNWVTIIQEQYNQSALRLFNYAVAGGCADEQVAPAPSCTMRGLPTERAQFIIDRESLQLDPQKTLYTLWIGINDVLHLLAEPAEHRAAVLDQKISNIFNELVPTLQTEGGAQHLVLLTVPPLSRRGGTEARFSPYGQAERAMTRQWNERLAAESKAFNARHAHPQIHIFDTFTVIGDVMDHRPTFGFKQKTSFCEAYKDLYSTVVSGDYNDPTCQAPIRQYIWKDDLHVTTHIHEIVAEAFYRFVNRDRLLAIAP